MGFCDWHFPCRCLHGVKKVTFFVGVGACLLFVLGAAIFGGSWLLQKEVKEFVKDGIYSQIIVDSFDADGYASWDNNYKDGHAVLYQDFYLYNITNINELANGATQIEIKLMGPYAYINNKQKIDVAFPDGGNQVTYREWTWWLFQPEMSCAGCKETDVVYNINPAYMGALAQTGGELEMIVALTGPTLREVGFGFLSGPFIQDITGQWRSPIIADAKIAILANLKMSPLQFYATWANATTQTSSLWKGMLVSTLSGTPSGISLASAEGLWNPSLQYSLLDGSLAAAKVWRRALNNDTQAFDQLKVAFSLSAPQLSSLLNWLNASCNPTLVYPNFTTSFGLSSLSDAAFLQWGQGVLTKGVSVQTLYPEMNFPIIPEINLWYASYGDPFATIDVPASKMFLAGPYGLFDALNLKTYLAAVEAGDFSKIKQDWGIDAGDVVMTALYFADVTTFWARPNLEKILNSGNGLFTNRTVNEWLWSMQDPIVSLLSPDAAQVALIVNQTSPEMTRALHKPNLCWTGKDDINKLGDYILFEDQSELVGYYTSTIKVEGTNDCGQFTPFEDMNTHIFNFDNNYLRKIELIPVEKVDIKGVTAQRYEIINSTWEPNYTYDQPIQGYANLSGSHKGAPIYVSNAHMYLCDPKYVAKVNGMKELQNLTFDTIIVDIEPYSGAVIHYMESLQVNIYLDPNNAGWFNYYTTNVKSDIFYPVMVAFEYSTLTDSDADKVKNNLYFGIKMETTLFWVAFGVGLGMFVVSLPLLALVFWRVRKERRAHSGGYAFVHDADTNINE